MCPVLSAVKINVLSGEIATAEIPVPWTVSKCINLLSSYVYSFISPDSLPASSNWPSGLTEKQLNPVSSSGYHCYIILYVSNDTTVNLLSVPNVKS